MSDENGVDIASGIARFAVADVSMAGLAHSITSVHNLPGYVNGFPFGRVGDNYDIGLGYKSFAGMSGGDFDYRNRFTVNIGGETEEFAVNSDGTLEATKGGTLVFSGGASSLSWCGGSTSGIVTYTSGIGVVAVMNRNQVHSNAGGLNEVGAGGCGAVQSIQYPDGTVVTLHHENSPGARVRSVTRNDGIQLYFRWGADGKLNGVTALNNAYEVCAPLAANCAPTLAWPASTYSRSADLKQLSITDMRGATTRFTMDRFYRVKSVKPPTSTVDTSFYTYCARPAYLDNGAWVYPQAGDGPGCTVQSSTIGGGGVPAAIELTRTYDRTVQVVSNGQTWTYEFPTGTYGPYYYVYRSQGPTGGTFALGTILGTGALTTFGSGWAKANYENSARNRMINGQARHSYPQTYTYDARGNITSDGVLQAYFEPCTGTNLKTCNKPSWLKDAKGNQTDFVYSPTHGGVTSVTRPPGANGVRPQTRYTYVQRYAWYKNSSGVMAQAATPIWKLDTERYCRTSAFNGTACSVARDEVVTTYEYGPNSGPNNLWLRGIAVTADGTTRRTCYGYDRYGNRITETLPKAGLTQCP